MNPVCLIFLDIDGVLSREFTKGSAERTLEAVVKFDKDALTQFDLVLETVREAGHRPGVVLSSSWRMKTVDNELVLHDLDYLKDLFEIHTFSDYLIGTTPIIGCRRSEATLYRQLEISKWLLDNLHKYQVGRVIVIDDLPMQHLGDCFVKCDEEQLFGEEERRKALEILLGDSK